MLVEIITPELQLFKGDAEAVQLPGLDGSFQVLKNHAPIISGLSVGIVKVDLTEPFQRSERTSSQIEEDKTNSKVIRIAIKGGVMELTNNKVIVLAE